MSLCLFLLLLSAFLRELPQASRLSFWSAVAVLVIGGNGWVTGALTGQLEWWM